MSFAQYNSGVSMETGSSLDPLKVGLAFLGVLSSIILSIMIVCLVWKLVEVLIEKYCSQSIPLAPQRDPLDVEKQAAGGRQWRITEMLKKVLSGSSASYRHLLNGTAPAEKQSNIGTVV